MTRRHSDEPRAGTYYMRRVKNGPKLAVVIWHGPPRDPLTGELLDRSHRWQAHVNGEEADPWAIWSRCRPIERPEYLYLLARHEYALQHDPSLPEAAPKSAVNLKTMKPPF